MQQACDWQRRRRGLPGKAAKAASTSNHPAKAWEGQGATEGDETSSGPVTHQHDLVIVHPQLLSTDSTEAARPDTTAHPGKGQAPAANASPDASALPAWKAPISGAQNASFAARTAAHTGSSQAVTSERQQLSSERYNS